MQKNILAIVSLLLISACDAVPQHGTNYQLVLSGGRVIDPESGFDAVADVAITDNQIVAISQKKLIGQETIDVSGLVVSPGFIDLHTHALSELGQQLQVQDGVTTALELEAGAFPVSVLQTLVGDKAVINYGASVSHLAVRQLSVEGIIQPHITLRKRPSEEHELLKQNNAFVTPASDTQLRTMREYLQQGLEHGGLGIGLLLDYVSSAVTTEELDMVFALAAQVNVPIFVHIKRSLPGDPAGLIEILELATLHNASVHICHLNASAMKGVDNYLSIIKAARLDGLDVTTEAYPYNAGSTLISASVFDKDWQSIFDITYEDIEWAETGMRFNQHTWHEYRQKYPKGQVIHHYGNELWTRAAINDPSVIIASDAMPINDLGQKVHPRGIGTFSRVLSQYTLTQDNQEGISLTTALAKMTILPAKRMQAVSSAFARKGRLRVGFDADITVFDPNIVTDKATYSDPIQPSKGIQHVIVNGVFAIQHGQLTGYKAGQFLTSDNRSSDYPN